MVPVDGLGENCDELIEAVNKRDSRLFSQALDHVAEAAKRASPGEVQDALARLSPVLRRSLGPRVSNGQVGSSGAPTCMARCRPWPMASVNGSGWLPVSIALSSS